MTDLGNVQAWRLDTSTQTLVFASTDGHMPCVVYWGGLLNAGEDIVTLAKSMDHPRAGALADYTPVLSICPEYGRGYHGECGLDAHDMDGRPLLTHFTIDTAKATTASLVFTLRDPSHALTYTATFTANQTSGIIEADAALHSAKPLMVNFLAAPVMAVPASASHLIDYAGRWTQEFGERLVPISRGVHMRQSKRGRTGHDHFPAMLFPANGCTWKSGEVYGIHLGFSGSHKMLVERLTDGRIAQLAGIAEPLALNAGGSVSSGKAYFGFSNEGRNGLSHSFQTHVRHAIVKFPEAKRARPVHYNCWEAVYFRHDLEELKELATRARSNGAERFVLDDGWFGKRDDDTSSLGDWVIDRRKFPDGLTPLIDHVEKLGMKFGIWFEPEMVNPNSDLARAHPDWIIAPEGRDTLTARNQLVLDFSNPAVTEHIFQMMDAVLTANNIDYIKWDMNRDLVLAVDKDGHGLLRRQIEAVYALMERLTTKYPNLEIESCASGGGRIDYGILAYTHRVWLSDSNDAHERWIMQNAALQFLPPEILGSHVGPRHCHTSGRNLSMAFRASVAACAHMGFEMDMRELTDQEQSELRRWTEFYKANRALLHSGRQYRLDTPTPETIAHMTVSTDKSRFILFSGSIESHRDETTQPLRLAGLDPHKLYHLTLVNGDHMADRATRHFTSPLVGDEGLTLSGAALCQAGLVLPFCFPQTMWVVTANAVAQG
jgi:alpha-galactosidase